MGTPTQLSTKTKDDLNLFGLAYVGSQGEGLVGISNHSSHITFDGATPDLISFKQRNAHLSSLQIDVFSQ